MYTDQFIIFARHNLYDTDTCQNSEKLTPEFKRWQPLVGVTGESLHWRFEAFPKSKNVSPPTGGRHIVFGSFVVVGETYCFWFRRCRLCDSL